MSENLAENHNNISPVHVYLYQGKKVAEWRKVTEKLAKRMKEQSEYEK